MGEGLTGGDADAETHEADCETDERGPLVGMHPWLLAGQYCAFTQKPTAKSSTMRMTMPACFSTVLALRWSSDKLPHERTYLPLLVRVDGTHCGAVRGVSPFRTSWTRPRRVVLFTAPSTVAAIRPCSSTTTVLGMEYGLRTPSNARRVFPSGS